MMDASGSEGIVHTAETNTSNLLNTILSII